MQRIRDSRLLNHIHPTLSHSRKEFYKWFGQRDIPLIVIIIIGIFLLVVILHCICSKKVLKIKQKQVIEQMVHVHLFHKCQE